MKLPARNAVALKRAGGDAAWTIVEMMIATAIFGMATIGMVTAHLAGLKLDELVESKLGASDSARRGFVTLANDVRSAKIWQVGFASGNFFVPIPNGTEQKGNALQLSLTTDTNIFIRYYFQSKQLRRRHSSETSYRTIAKDLTNQMWFAAETYRGTNQTDLSHKGVIHVWLEFAQFQFPQTKVGPGHLYDYYKMEFRLTPHVPDGP